MESPISGGASRLDLVLRAGIASRAEPTGSPVSVVAPRMLLTGGRSGGGSDGGRGGRSGGRKSDEVKEELARQKAKIAKIEMEEGLEMSKRITGNEKANPLYEWSKLGFYLEAQDANEEPVWGAWFVEQKTLLSKKYIMSGGNMDSTTVTMSGIDQDGTKQTIFITVDDEAINGYGRDPWRLLKPKLEECRKLLPSLKDARLTDMRFFWNYEEKDGTMLRMMLRVPFENIDRFVFYTYNKADESLYVKDTVYMHNRDGA